MADLSVIVPVLNEAGHLPLLLSGLHAQEGIDLEIIVADGGSDDGSPDVAAAAGAHVVASPRGRGRQMNAGASEASAATLLFLHADSRTEDTSLIRCALDALDAAIREHGHDRVAGHFSLNFESESGAQRDDALRFRFLEAKSALNRPNTTNGDQGFILRRTFFERLGGFDERLPFLEDQKLAEEIRFVGEWITLPGTLTTSSRRFEAQGFGKSYLLMAIIMGLFSADVEDAFERSPDLYHGVEERGELQLTPFFDLLQDVQAKMSLRDVVAGWVKTGRFVRENTWQVFFLLDVAADVSEESPFLSLYDQKIAPVIEGRWANYVSAGLAFAVFMVVLPPLFRLLER